MFNKLTEIVLPPIIGVMVHRNEALSSKAQKTQDAYLANLNIGKRKTAQPLIVGLLGLVGSGKSSVAIELVQYIGGTVVESDAIRVLLRKEGEAYKYVRQIAENIALEVIQRGGNIILDADQIDDRKRASIREKAGKAGARLVFIRAYADPDVMFGRILSANYQNRPDDFFGGAKTSWQGTDQERGAVIKLREAWRRTPHHYRWINEGGGRWELKKLPFALFADIDTTDSTKWRKKIKEVAQKLIAL